MPISTLEHLPATESLDLKTRNGLQVKLIKRSGRPSREWIEENSGGAQNQKLRRKFFYDQKIIKGRMG